ncbi:MAG: sensor domain-containing diguanylate cyclase [Candidatus Korobacteraceae bacterium]
MKIAPAASESKLYDLSIFHDVAKALTSSLDLDVILEILMQKMAAYFAPAIWALVLLDESSRQPQYVAPVEPEFERLNQVRLRSEHRLAAYVLETGDPLVIADLHTDPRIDPDTVDPLIATNSAVVCLPVRSVHSVFGVIQLLGIDMQVYEQNELFLRTIADYAAIAIDNAHAVRRIQELSITDDCTKLYNQRHLFTVLDEEVHRSARFGYQFSLLFLDLDHFKSVNDMYGHLVGSKLIALVGQCLRENLRLIDAAFRYGGDEFAILLPQTSRDSALYVARRIARAFHNRDWRPEENISIRLRASIGIASYPHDASSSQDVVQRADELMYQVKQSGRDNIAVAGLGIVGIGDPSATD